MDSRMIDVAIGLVLVFALVSLAVTTVHEIWVSVRKSRGRNLEAAVQSILGEDGVKGGFAGKLLEHPLIVSLADTPLGGSGKPSYIGADMFVTTLIAQLSKMYCAGVRPDTPQAFVAAIRLGAGRLQMPEPALAFVEGLAALLDGAESDWDIYLKRIAAWYDAVGERSIGWFKRATQIRLFAIGWLLAAAVNINPFVIAPRLWNDEAMRKAAVQMAERAAVAYERAASAGDSQTVWGNVAPALVSGNSSVPAPVASISPIELEYEMSVDALKRTIAATLLAQRQRGSVQLLDRLSSLLDLLAEIEPFVKLRRSAALDGKRQAVKDASDLIDRRIEQLGVTIAGSELRGSNKTELVAHHARVATAAQHERERLLPVARESVTRRCPVLTDLERQKQCEQLLGITTDFAQLGLPIGWTTANLPDCAHGPCVVEVGDALVGKNMMGGSATADASQQLTLSTVKACFSDFSCAGISLAGWMATALATMLGAPFWFDLLGKLIKLRSSGTRPADKGTTGTDAGGASMNTLMVNSSAAPPDAGVSGVMRDVQTSAEAGLSPERILEVQASLQKFGAQASGYFDHPTRRAILAWQKDVGESQTGELTQAQIDRLLSPGSAMVLTDEMFAAEQEHLDGCDVEITSATPDEDLPAAQGGVAQP